MTVKHSYYWEGKTMFNSLLLITDVSRKESGAASNGIINVCGVFFFNFKLWLNIHKCTDLE